MPSKLVVSWTVLWVTLFHRFYGRRLRKVFLQVVQSVALKLIIDRENEIKAFKPEEYWTIDGAFKKGAKKFQASFYGLDGKKLKLNNNDDVQAVLSRITSDDFNVDKVEKKERRRNAPLPYTTSSLQQDAANKINFRTRKTMMVAQQL